MAVEESRQVIPELEREENLFVAGENNEMGGRLNDDLWVVVYVIGLYLLMMC